MIEAAFGYPPALLRLIGHPVMWIGAMIGWTDRTMNRGGEVRRRLAGVGALLLVVAAAGFPAMALQSRVPSIVFSQTLLAMTAWGALAACLASSLLAQRSLFEHVRRVEVALRDSLAAGRIAVSQIVGRDPASLDEAGVARAAIESLAENFSDGVVAPAFWCAVAGLPGIVAYKAINTADSMIGHRTPRHAAFGWAAARLDDVINLPASRLAALWLIAASLLHPRADAARAARAVWRDAAKHRSPNAGWPEAAMAGALGLRLAGPRVYGGRLVEDVFMGDGRAECGADDIGRALVLYRTACALQIVVAVALAFSLAS